MCHCFSHALSMTCLLHWPRKHKWHTVFPCHPIWCLWKHSLAHMYLEHNKQTHQSESMFMCFGKCYLPKWMPGSETDPPKLDRISFPVYVTTELAKEEQSRVITSTVSPSRSWMSLVSKVLQFPSSTFSSFTISEAKEGIACRHRDPAYYWQHKFQWLLKPRLEHYSYILFSGSFRKISI